MTVLHVPCNLSARTAEVGMLAQTLVLRHGLHWAQSIEKHKQEYLKGLCRHVLHNGTLDNELQHKNWSVCPGREGDTWLEKHPQNVAIVTSAGHGTAHLDGVAVDDHEYDAAGVGGAADAEVQDVLLHTGGQDEGLFKKKKLINSNSQFHIYFSTV